MEPKITVSITALRYRGLDWQFKLLKNQTFQDFEIVLMDGCWMEREEQVKELADKLGLRLVYLREEFPFKTFHVRPISGNRKIKAASGELIVFIDEYMVFPDNYLQSFWDAYKQGLVQVARRQGVKYCGDIDYSIEDLKVSNEDNRYLEIPKHSWIKDSFSDGFYRDIPWGWWWPSSSCIPKGYFVSVGGYNELYCGGTSGEDNDLACRMRKFDIKYVYNPDLIVYHINHGRLEEGNNVIPIRSIPHRLGNPICNFKHDRRSFTNNNFYPHGDRSLVENGQLFTWYNDGYKLFQCKYCKEVGAIDGVQLLGVTTERFSNGVYIPPNKIVFPDGEMYNCTKFEGVDDEI